MPFEGQTYDAANHIKTENIEEEPQNPSFSTGGRRRHSQRMPHHSRDESKVEENSFLNGVPMHNLSTKPNEQQLYTKLQSTTKVTFSDGIRGKVVEQILRNAFIQAKINTAEYEVDFSFLRMTRFLIYHLLWFSFGLLSLLLLIPLEGVAMCRNMAFFPVHNRFFYELLMQQMTFFLMVMMYFMNNPPNIYIEEVYFAVLALFIRSFIIACRYGFISEERLRIVRKGKQKVTYLKSDLILFNIVTIRPQALEDEIPASIWRNEIEEDDFEFRFLERPSNELHEKQIARNYYLNKKFSRKGTVTTNI